MRKTVLVSAVASVMLFAGGSVGQAAPTPPFPPGYDPPVVTNPGSKPPGPGSGRLPAVVDGCVNGVHIFGLQGTNDTNSGALRGITRTLHSVIPRTTVKAYAVEYGVANIDASNVGNFLTRWSTAVTTGTRTLSDILRVHLARCPNEHIVVVGYSQGAAVASFGWDAVMGQRLNGVDGMTRYKGRMDGLLLFGHPYFNPAQRDRTPAYSLDRGTFDKRRHGLSGSQGVPTWSRSQETNHLMRSWCDVTDPICNPWPGMSIIDLIAQVRFGVHSKYPAKYAPLAGLEMGRWLAGHYHMT